MASNNTNVTCPSRNETSFDCSLFRNCQCPYLQADADIGGIGVVLSFLITAGLTLVTTIIGRISALLAEEELPNTWDKAVRNFAIRRFHPSASKVKFIVSVTKKLLIGFRDQQLVTGIAMLVTGICRLPPNQGQISVYHFTTVYATALFSSSTLLAASGVLQYDAFDTHRLMRYFRALWMIIMYLLLITVVVISGTGGPSESFGCPATCLMQTWADFWDSFSTISSGFSILTLSLSYFYLLSPMFKKATRSNQAIEKMREKSRVMVKVLDFLYLDIMGTISNSVIFGWGIYRLWKDRMIGTSLMAEDQSENLWGFGQILPFLLLILPIISTLDIVYEVRKETHHASDEIPLRNTGTYEHASDMDGPDAPGDNESHEDEAVSTPSHWDPGEGINSSVEVPTPQQPGAIGLTVGEDLSRVLNWITALPAERREENTGSEEPHDP